MSLVEVKTFVFGCDRCGLVKTEDRARTGHEDVPPDPPHGWLWLTERKTDWSLFVTPMRVLMCVQCIDRALSTVPQSSGDGNG